MKKIILILGGARSGKSHHAVELAREINKRTVFLATMEFIDDEMKERIKLHKQNRPAEWQTVEEGKNVDKILFNLKGLCDVVIIDCLTNLVSNLLLELDDINHVKSEVSNSDMQTQNQTLNSTATSPLRDPVRDNVVNKVKERIKEILDIIAQMDITVIIVSNEVGCGIVPETPLGRKFRDIAGMANNLVAKHADEVYLLTAGIPMRIKPSYGYIKLREVT